MDRNEKIQVALVAVRVAAVLAVVVACAGVLAGPIGDDVSTSGTTAPVLLGFLLATYPLVGVKAKRTRHK